MRSLAPAVFNKPPTGWVYVGFILRQFTIIDVGWTTSLPNGLNHEIGVSSTICSLSTRQFYKSESVYMQLNQTRNDKRRMYFQEKKLLRQLLFTQTQSGSGFTASEMAGSHNEYETHFITETTFESVLQYFFTLLFVTCFNTSFLEHHLAKPLLSWFSESLNYNVIKTYFILNITQVNHNTVTAKQI